MPIQRVTIHTDGACSKNPGPGGWAAMLAFGDHRRAIQGSAAHTTSNRMELVAALEGLRSLSRRCAVDLYTDSLYLRNGMTRWLPRWKANGFKTRAHEPVKNEDLWRGLDEQSDRHNITWHWVRGHTGNRDNELCDSLAKEALEGRSRAPYSATRLPGESPVAPARLEKRHLTLPDGSSREVEVKVYDAAWAVGASRQVHGRKGNKLRP